MEKVYWRYVMFVRRKWRIFRPFRYQPTIKCTAEISQIKITFLKKVSRCLYTLHRLLKPFSTLTSTLSRTAVTLKPEPSKRLWQRRLRLIRTISSKVTFTDNINKIQKAPHFLEGILRKRLETILSEKYHPDRKVQSTPDNSNLQGKQKIVRVIGSSSYRG